MELGRWGLVIVDLQRYYVDPAASFVRFFEHIRPGASEYVTRRVHSTVLPNLTRVLGRTREVGAPVLYLRLCGSQPDRSDLHRHFQRSNAMALRLGFEPIYPLGSEPMADVLPPVEPAAGDTVIDKTTYSGFTFSRLPQEVERLGLEMLVFAGLATSQCVETTARDASDRGYRVLHLEDCQADYEEISHRASLFSSRMVCGDNLFSTEEFLALL